jgi:hypothetical protein
MNPHDTRTPCTTVIPAQADTSDRGIHRADCTSFGQATPGSPVSKSLEWIPGQARYDSLSNFLTILIGLKYPGSELSTQGLSR